MSHHELIESIYVIRHIESGKLIKFGSKGGWISVGAAKSAFNLWMKHEMGKDYFDDCRGMFDGQGQYVIEEVK